MNVWLVLCVRHCSFVPLEQTRHIRRYTLETYTTLNIRDMFCTILCQVSRDVYEKMCECNIIQVFFRRTRNELDFTYR